MSFLKVNYGFSFFGFILNIPCTCVMHAFNVNIDYHFSNVICFVILCTFFFFVLKPKSYKHFFFVYNRCYALVNEVAVREATVTPHLRVVAASTALNLDGFSIEQLFIVFRQYFSWIIFQVALNMYFIFWSINLIHIYRIIHT